MADFTWRSNFYPIMPPPHPSTLKDIPPSPGKVLRSTLYYYNILKQNILFTSKYVFDIVDICSGIFKYIATSHNSQISNLL